MHGMFFKCESLNELPDISKWNISKVNDMEAMFYEYSQLSNFPNISNWMYNINHVRNKKDMFKNCNLYIPYDL